MIKKIDIKKFGLFSDYNWDKEVGNDLEKDVFKKVNILYGRNYSGKTTLSRIFRCVENKELHEDYEDAEFTITTDEGSINQSDLNYNKKIRVYNTDFVKKNLSWLHDNDNGKIEPFTLVSIGEPEIEKNIQELEKDIKDIDIKLGTLTEGADSFEEDTLYFKKNLKKREVTNAKDNVSNLEKDLTSRIRNKANNEIKKNSVLHNQRYNYDVRQIQTEIDDIRNNNLNCLLTEEDIDFQKSRIKEDEKNSISSIPPLNLNFKPHLTSVKDLLVKEIKISKGISESIERDLLDWLKLGCKLHKETDICEFCQNPISTQRRNELEAFFNKESEELEEKIQTLINQLESLKTVIESYLPKYNIKKDRFYVVLQPKFDEIKSKWEKAEINQIKQIDLLKDNLSNRLKDLYTPIKDIDFKDIEVKAVDFNPIIDEFNNLIVENKNKTKRIEKEKDSAREKLRYHTIKKFLTDINYDVLLENIEKAKIKKTEAEDEYKKITDTVSETEEQKEEKEKQIAELKTKLNDQSVAAEKINEHLRNFFGHDSIQLKPSEKQIGDEVVTRFVVKRGNEEAKNLSEGECSLVAFCYFMATIENELEDSDAKDKLIIYIDDPISSLDNNHIFFVFGLINSIIVFADKIDNIRFNQLFISTHNLEFLKYLHRLAPFKGTYEKDSNKNMMHLLIEKRRKGYHERSLLRLMPKHLRINTTEYIYLFKQIYDIAKPYNNIDDKIKDYEDNYTLLYNIGNNMRKFMESYLSFKYAGENDPLYLLNDFFSEIEGIQLNRASNEYSHLSWLEKGNSLLDIPEAERLATLILRGLKSNDETHYHALCKKTEADPNIVLS